MAMVLFQLLVSGILLGCVYVLIAVGYNLILGVMKVINLAYGDFLMLASYSTFWLFTLYGVDPFLSIFFNMFIFFVGGFVIQKFIINRVVDQPPTVSLLLTFGVGMVIQGAALSLWWGDFRGLELPYSFSTLYFLGVSISVLRLIASVVSIGATAAMFLLLQRTKLGKAIRATSQNRSMAALMGVNTKRLYAIVFGLSLVLCATAGTILATLFSFYPQVGLMYITKILAIVVIGGLGSFRGAFVSGLMIAIIESLASFYIGGWSRLVVVYIILLIVLQVRPQGLFGHEEKELFGRGAHGV